MPKAKFEQLIFYLHEKEPRQSKRLLGLPNPSSCKKFVILVLKLRKKEWYMFSVDYSFNEKK